jgi:hypothetical protein
MASDIRESAERELRVLGEVHFCYDLGTNKGKAGAQLLPCGSRPEARNTTILRFQEGGDDNEQIPQAVGFHRRAGQWIFVWGWELQALRQKHISLDDLAVFKHLKPCLLDADDEQGFRAKIERELERIGFGDKTVEWLHEQEWRAKRAAAKADAQRRYPSIDFNCYKEVNYIAVPEISTPNTNATLAAILKEAGFPDHPILISETEASGSWALWKAKYIRELSLAVQDFKVSSPDPTLSLMIADL